MKKAAIVLIAGIVWVQGAVQAAGSLEPLRFLVGTWDATGTGSPGQGAGQYTFREINQGKALLRMSYAEHPATKDAPASRHTDTMIVYHEGSAWRGDYCDSEGHAIHYRIDVPEPGTAVFLSDSLPGAPRYRLTYRAHAGAMDGAFDIAGPGGAEFKNYLSWSARKSVAGTGVPGR